MTSNLKKILLKALSGFALFLVNQAFAAHSDHSVDFQTFLNDWRTQNQVTSVVVSIENIKTHHIQSFTSGARTQEGSASVTTQSVYGVGSISKTFVSAALLQLQEEKKLNLDAPIGPYFPEYPRWNQITIRQLLNMTSGIYNFTESADFKALDATSPTRIIPPQALIQIAYDAPDYFKPGKGWHYSNTNYFLAGLIIEKVSHEPLEKVYQQRFFKPLHLNHTFYSAGFYPKAVEEAMAHAYADGRDITNFNAGLPGAAGSMVMDSQDLLTWTQALFTPGKILDQASFAEFETAIPIPFSPPKPEGAAYGLGVYSLDVPRVGMIWYYAGVGIGYTSVFVWIPSQQRIIVVEVASISSSNFAMLFPNQPLIEKLLAESTT